MKAKRCHRNFTVIKFEQACEDQFYLHVPNFHSFKFNNPFTNIVFNTNFIIYEEIHKESINLTYFEYISHTENI